MSRFDNAVLSTLAQVVARIPSSKKKSSVLNYTLVYCLLISDIALVALTLP